MAISYINLDHMKQKIRQKKYLNRKYTIKKSDFNKILRGGTSKKAKFYSDSNVYLYPNSKINHKVGNLL